ncbi:MAG: hypothetical protein HWN68_21150 [Desulfobacterales bacterium]|nr:hypothetical protein [Desulfobacterales bacterium]
MSLNKIVEGGDGDKPIELSELIADNKSINPGTRLDAKLDARRILQGLPKRLVQIGYKIYAGIPLETKEKEYLKHWQKAHPIPIVSMIYHPIVSAIYHPVKITPKALQKIWLGERILELLRKKPQGMTRSDLSMRLQVPVRGINLYLNQFIKREQIIAVKRWNTRGRPQTPLLVIAGAEIPEQKNVSAERDERIRQAYFVDGWSIKRINRELHHDNRTIRRAIYGIKIERR